ncbi:MAG TPA: SIR2 family protein [Bacteroidia bacterium]|nr:SIR2 family protein [Bacteroidia bacterium]
MDNQFHTSINKIKEAQNQNKLVVFVGAGVSMNSGIPSWNDLVDILKKDMNLSKDETDFIKIPELYYRQRGYNEYITKIRTELNYKKARYTEIHKLLFELKPLHIITTNYDDLLEQYAFENSLPYQVIKQDKDLPYATSNSYIIKMHGDLELGNIVLKESDYLNYNKNFPLIESYIKSLFASKLILFVGFSYSDYNIKFITQNVLSALGENLQPAYLLELKEESEYLNLNLESDYLKNYGINLFCYNKIIGSTQSDISHPRGQKLHSFLNYIKNYDSFLEKNRGRDRLTKLYNYFLKFSEINVFIPHRIAAMFQSVEINTSIDYDNPHCLIIREDSIRIFIETYGKQWASSKTLEEKINLIETFIERKLSMKEVEALLYIWKKVVLSGVFYLTYIDIHSARNQFINITSPEFYIEDEIDMFYKGDFLKVEKYVNDNKESFDINKLVVAAYLCYKTGKHVQAYTILSKASSIAWQNRNYLKYYLCKYNIEKLKYSIGSKNFQSQKKQLEIIRKDIAEIDLDEIFYSLSKNDRELVNPIRNFTNYDFKSFDYNLSKNTGKEGYSFETFISISNKVFQIWNFFNFNYLFGEHYEEYALVYKRSFIQLLEFLTEDPNIPLNRNNILLALYYFDNNEILQAFNRVRVPEIKVDEATIVELIESYKNLIINCQTFIKRADFDESSNYNSIFRRLINNYIQVFAFIKLDKTKADLILDELFSKVFINANYGQGHGVYYTSPQIRTQDSSIVRFLINQSSFGTSISENILNKILFFSVNKDLDNAGLLKYIVFELLEQNPTYKVTDEFIEKNIVHNFGFHQKIEILISLQPILENDYTDLIKENINISLDNYFDIRLFAISLEKGYIDFLPNKDKLYKAVENLTNDSMQADFLPYEELQYLFAKIIIEQKINIKKDDYLLSIIRKSTFLTFLLDLDNLNLEHLLHHWILKYTQTLFDYHKKFKNIKRIKNTIKEIMIVLNDKKDYAIIYFQYFEGLK